MPSPFPGMDPYLEDPAGWRDVNHELISELRAELNRRLLPRYFARIEERVYISDEGDPGRVVLIPDVRVLRNAVKDRSSSGAALFPAEDDVQPIEIGTLVDDEIHEAYLTVVDKKDRSVVTAIEVLSPTNKTRGSRGHASYLEKRREILRSEAHLIEIDLLRAGERVFIGQALPSHDYLVHINRVLEDNRRRSTVWPIPLDRRLPTIPIPLRHGDLDVFVSLQTVMNTAYDRAAYGAEIDYAKPANPPLNQEQAQWAKAIINQNAR